MREYRIEIIEENGITLAHALSAPIQHTGESNATELVIELNDELLEPDIEYYNLVFSLGYKNKNTEHLTALSDVITADSDPGYISEGCIHYPLRGALTCFSSLGCQVEGHTADNSATVKSPVFEIRFSKSLIADSVLCDIPAQDLKEKLTAIESSLHFHENTATLGELSCKALDDPLGFGTQMGDENDLKFRGKSVRLMNDGMVISSVMQVEKDGEKFIRLSLFNNNINMSFGDEIGAVDIPLEYVSAAQMNTALESAYINTVSPAVTSVTLRPNTKYVFGEAASLNIALGEPIEGRYCEYMFSFVSGATPTTLTLPDTVSWGNGNELTVQANMRYEVSIADNIALWCSAEVTQ